MRTDLDCRGMPCPRPVMEVARAITEVDVGDLVAVASDDPAAGNDIAAYCRMRGHDLTQRESAADGVPVYVVRRAQ